MKLTIKKIEKCISKEDENEEDEETPNITMVMILKWPIGLLWIQKIGVQKIKLVKLTDVNKHENMEINCKKNSCMRQTNFSTNITN